GLEKKVTLTGTLDEDSVLKMLRKSDVLMLTSFGSFEAAPVCVMEAMALGKPTITSIIGGTRDMVTNEVDGFLVEQRNVDQIEAALMSFVTDRNLVTKCGLATSQKATRDFNSLVQAKELLAEIDK